MQDLDLLEQRIKRSAIQDFFVAASVLALAALALVGAASRVMAADYSQAAFIALLGLCMVLASWAMAQSGRALWPARSSVIYRAMTGDSKTIAWAHLTTGSTSSLKVYFLDGDMVTLYANRQGAETLLAFVHHRAPHAIFGYAPEQQRLYAERVKSNRALAGANQ